MPMRSFTADRIPLLQPVAFGRLNRSVAQNELDLFQAAPEA